MEKLKVKRETVLLVIILLVVFALRVWGINFGLPYILHQDESIVVNHAMAYGAGDLNPHFFAIPPLTSYLLFIIYGAYFLIGRLLGIFQTVETFALSFLKDPTIFFILGRLFIGAIPGTLCVFFTFMLYKRLFKSAKGALFAASIMAFSFLNVLDSHYIYTDMLMTLFVIIGVIRSIALWEKPSIKNYIYAGIVLGISAGIKYNAAILVVPCLIAHIMASKSRPVNKNLCISILSSIVAFILVNPFSLLDFKFFISSVIGQAGASGYVGWTHHITYSLYEGVGIFTIIAGFLGMIALFLSNKGKAAILLSFPAVFYMHLVFLSQHFPRYVLALVPFFAIATGYFIFEYILPMIKSEVFKKIVISLSIIPVAVLSIKPISANVLLTSVDTRIQAAEWIESNINPKDAIAFDHTFFRPFIYHNQRQLKDKYAILDKQKGLEGIKEKKLDLMLKANEGRQGYYIYYLSSNPGGQGQFLSTTPAVAFDYNELKAKGVKYISINYYNRQKDVQDFYDMLRKQAVLVYSISPYYDEDIRFTCDTIATTCMPVMSKELFSRKRQGPAIEIYKLR
jgi:hypothetical protein